jgi:hypothetical protein
MPREPSENTIQIAIRVPKDWPDRAKALKSWIARPGVAVTRADVFRVALARGLEILEAERAADKKKGGRS